MHGSPCQDFSIAGKQAGGDENSGTRSSLMYETLRIIKKLKPKYVIWENVANLLSEKHKHNFDNYIIKMRELGYISYYQVLNAKDYSIPQNRQRIFTVSILNELNKGFEFPKKQILKLRLKDMLENNVDEKYYLSDKMIEFFKFNYEKQKEKGNGFKFEYTDGECIAKSITTRAGSRMDDNFIISSTQKHATISKDGIVPTLTSAMGMGGGHIPMHNLDLRIRKLTPKECWRLMGFNDEDFQKAEKVNSDAQLYKQAGNSIVVNVLEAILYNLLCCNFENKNVKDLLNVEQFTFDDLTI